MESDSSDENLLRHMDDVARHYLISSAEFRGWADTVEGEARMICNDQKGERIRFVVTERPGRFAIDIGEASTSTIACIIKAIRQNLARMPDNLSMWFMELLRYLEIREKKLQAQEGHGE